MKLRKAIIVFFLILSFEGTGFAQLAQVGPTGASLRGNGPCSGSRQRSRGYKVASAHLHNRFNNREFRLLLSRVITTHTRATARGGTTWPAKTRINFNSTFSDTHR